MKEIQGDVLQDIGSEKLVVLHGCNCLHIMGGGIAAYLRAKYPKVYAADLVTPKFSASKLGTYSVADIDPTFHILNCYTQFGINGDKYGNPPFDYNAFRSCLTRLRRDTTYTGWNIRMPRIGCGLADGDWSIVKSIIEDELNTRNVEVYYL